MDKDKTGLGNIINEFPLQMPTAEEMISRVQYLREKDNKDETKKTI